MKAFLMNAYIMSMCYSLGAFINWDFNAGNWSEFARFFVVLSWFFMSIIVIVYEEGK
jgi:hypothetical protein